MRLPWLGKSRRAGRTPSSADTFHTETIADVLVPGRAEHVRFFGRRLVSAGRLRTFNNKDLRELLLAAFYLGVAAVLPASRWAAVCSRVSGLRLKRHMRKEFPRYGVATRAVLGSDIDAEKQFRAFRAAAHRWRLLVAAHLVGNKWSPVIRLEGLEGLQAALDRGHGAIIWCDQFTSQTVIGKRALYEAGIETHQLSVSAHGISGSKFGRRFLNPMLIQVENRFLKSRIVFDRADAYHVTSRIQKILGNNGVVLITNAVHAGSTFTEAGIGENGWTHLASSPTNFAARGKAALFSMSTFETDPFRQYLAVVSPELVPAWTPTGERAPRAGGTKNMTLQAEYVLLKRDHLLEALKLYPEQMMVWFGQHRFTERPGNVLPGDGDL
ncbi:hypothetical protein LB513_08545 [Mesorhizobium sp. ES1-1]|nr:hypothetical protein [Mesorhizobium sp. ES1-1]